MNTKYLSDRERADRLTESKADFLDTIQTILKENNCTDVTRSTELLCPNARYTTAHQNLTTAYELNGVSPYEAQAKAVQLSHPYIYAVVEENLSLWPDIKNRLKTAYTEHDGYYHHTIAAMYQNNDSLDLLNKLVDFYEKRGHVINIEDTPEACAAQTLNDMFYEVEAEVLTQRVQAAAINAAQATDNEREEAHLAYQEALSAFAKIHRVTGGEPSFKTAFKEALRIGNAAVDTQSTHTTALTADEKYQAAVNAIKGAFDEGQQLAGQQLLLANQAQR